jgi:RNAse (barnase) inhibitor barstar
VEQEKIITLDLTGCKYLGELHQRIKEAFDFPDFYGENWDAFWDLLRSECDADKVMVVGGDSVSKELSTSVQTMKGILEEFQELCDKDGDPVEIEIRS